MISLRPRLRAAASLVRGGGVLADIGTDHAYLPVWLLQNGVIESAVAADIVAGPLANAKRTAERCGLQHAIDLRLSNGLMNICPEEVDEIVICGMGGTLIAEILTSAPWVKNERLHFVLQPMSHAQDVRRYLSLNGFQIEKELFAADAGRVYLTLSAAFTGAPARTEPGEWYFGELPPAGECALRFTRRQLEWVSTRLNAIKAANRCFEEQAELTRVLQYYKEHAGNNESTGCL